MKTTDPFRPLCVFMVVKANISMINQLQQLAGKEPLRVITPYLPNIYQTGTSKKKSGPLLNQAKIPI